MSREVQYRSGVCHVCRADLILTEMLQGPRPNDRRILSRWTVLRAAHHP